MDILGPSAQPATLQVAVSKARSIALMIIGLIALAWFVQISILVRR